MKKLALFTLLTGFGLTMMTGCDQTKNNNQTLSFDHLSVNQISTSSELQNRQMLRPYQSQSATVKSELLVRN